MPSGPSDGNTMTYQVDMRWDLYQKLGSPKMTEMEDILPVLKKMQELEAEERFRQRTYGLSLWGDWDGNYMTLAKQPGSIYGYDLSDGFNEGTLLEISANEEKYQGILDDNSYYLRSLKFYYDANKMGLLDPDSMTQKFEDVVNKYKDGELYPGSLGRTTLTTRLTTRMRARASRWSASARRRSTPTVTRRMATTASGRLAPRRSIRSGSWNSSTAAVYAGRHDDDAERTGRPDVGNEGR